MERGLAPSAIKTGFSGSCLRYARLLGEFFSFERKRPQNTHSSPAPHRWYCRTLSKKPLLAAPARVSSGVYANCIKWMQHTLVLQHEALSLKPPKAYVTRLLGGRETTRSLKRKRDRLK